MASLRKVARNEADTIRDGIGWVIVYRTGRSWNSVSIWLSNDTIDPEDMRILEEILKQDAGAVALNSYYCGHFTENMTVAEIAAGIRWHYENSFNLLSDFIENNKGAEHITDESLCSGETHSDLSVNMAWLCSSDTGSLRSVYQHQFPNLAAEIELRNTGSLDSCASHAGVSTELLEGFLAGEKSCDLSSSELNKLVRYTSFSFNGCHRSNNYLLAPKLGYYMPKKLKHRRKLLLVWRELEAARLINQTLVYHGKSVTVYDDLPSFSGLCDKKMVPAALVNHAIEFIGNVYRWHRIVEQEKQPTVRQKPA